MSYFQNPLDAEFQGNLVLSDRQYSVTFKVKGNSPNSNQLFQAWNPAPYNVSSLKNLTLNYSFDAGNSWTVLTIDTSTTAATTSAATAFEIASALNANATFQALFTASVNQDNKNNAYVVIKSSRAREKFKVYVSNGNAEKILRFNKKAGVAEFPTYFARHTIANKSAYPDSIGTLVQLDLTTTQDQQIVQEAGFSYAVGVTNSGPTATIGNTSPFNVGDSVVVFDGTTTLSTTISSITANTSLTLNNNWTGSTESTAQLVVVHADYQLLRGRSGLFQFQKITYDGNTPPRPTSNITYSAGALPGDLAMKTTYHYTSTNTLPDIVAQVPYTLTSSDLVTPP